MFNIMKKRLRTVKYAEYIEPHTNEKYYYFIVKRIKKKESIYYLLLLIRICICTIVHNKRINEFLLTSQGGIKTTNKCILFAEVGQVI